jgi:hypothetical protein
MASVVDDHILRLDVFMDEALPVGLANCRGQPDGNAKEKDPIDLFSFMLLNHPIEQFTTWISEYEGRSPSVPSQRERPSRPFCIEFRCERVFMFEPPESLRRRLLSSNRHRQDRH